MALKPGGARSKGQTGEREIIKLLEGVVKEAGEGALFRNLDQVRGGGHDIIGIDWLAIEVKRCETLNVEAWWRQAVEQAEKTGPDGKPRVPVLIYRQNRKAWHVVMNGAVTGNNRTFWPTRVEISLWDFKEWLKKELLWRKETTEKAKEAEIGNGLHRRAHEPIKEAGWDRVSDLDFLSAHEG